VLNSVDRLDDFHEPALTARVAEKCATGTVKITERWDLVQGRWFHQLKAS